MPASCAQPCPVAIAGANDRIALCAHLIGGAACIDAWLALATLVETTQQRIDCYEHAHRIAPDDLDIHIALLELRAELAPADSELTGQLRELHARRAVRGVTPRSWRPRDPSPPLGTLLVNQRVVSETDLRRVLAEQRARAAIGRRTMLGDLLIEQGIITPEALVNILMQQFGERRMRSERPQGVGEQLVITGVLGERQLADALLAQTRLRQQGRSEPIGKILLQLGLVTEAELQQAIRELDELAIQALGW